MAFRAVATIDLVLYAGLLCLAVYNTVFFLILQRRYKIYYIMTFYVLSYVLIACRLVVSALILVLAFQHDTSYNTQSSMYVLVILVFEIGATYAKIFIGFFQVIAITILTLQVKQKHLNKMRKISYWLYLLVTAWNVAILLAVIGFITFLMLCLERDGSEDNCYGATKLGTILNGVCFAVLTACLLIAIFPLFHSLNRLQSIKMQLSREVKFLSSIFAVFTLGYLTRTVYDFTVPASVQFWQLMTGITLPLFWDFLPIGLMFYYHL